MRSSAPDPVRAITLAWLAPARSRRLRSQPSCGVRAIADHHQIAGVVPQQRHGLIGVLGADDDTVVITDM
jgi:hypothetical protein